MVKKYRSYRKRPKRKVVAIMKNPMIRRTTANSLNVKLKTTASVGTTGAGIIDQQYRCSGVTAHGDWSNYQGTWEQFIVRGIKVKFFPRNVPGGNVVYDGVGVTQPYLRGNTGTYIDMNGSFTATGMLSVLQERYGKIVDSYKVSKRFARVPKAQRPKLNNMASGYDSANSDVLIGIYGDTYNGAGTPSYWFVQVTWYVTFKGVQ